MLDENYRSEASYFFSRIIDIIKIFLDELNTNYMKNSLYNKITKINLFRYIHTVYYFQNIEKMNLSDIKLMINNPEYIWKNKTIHNNQFCSNYDSSIYTNYLFDLNEIIVYNTKYNNKSNNNDINYNQYTINGP